MRFLHEAGDSGNDAVQRVSMHWSRRYTAMMNSTQEQIAFIGGGNMASALIGGLVNTGRAPASLLVIDPGEAQRTSLQSRFGVRTQAAPDAALAGSTLVVWAVKPQLFGEAAAPAAAHVAEALQLSVMAGIRCNAIERATGAKRIVRSMPNTPALIGRGIAGLFATPEVQDAQRTPMRMQEQALASLEDSLEIIGTHGTHDDLLQYSDFVVSLAMRVARSAKEGDLLGIGGQLVSAGEKAFIDQVESAVRRVCA